MKKRAFARAFVVASFAGVSLLCCGKADKTDAASPPLAAPPPNDHGCAPECVTAIPCRRHDCNGAEFWNGCCPCPKDTVSGFSCPPDARAP